MVSQNISMEKARVVLFEDQKNVRALQKRALQNRSHQVVSEVTTLLIAREQIPTMNEVDVAVVDGNLKQGDNSGKDGAEIVEQIKEIMPHIVTIGCSATGEVVGADYQADKRNIGEIAAIIDSLEMPKNTASE